MGGGDLNMKKSWHPLLQVNQERVWKREKEAIEERKKLEELRREREQEREMQELQRLQEEAGGKKRVDKVDWMYATPATTGSNSAAEMEDYLLGKKRVDKLLQGEENKEVSKSSQKSLISLQSANSARDLAAKKQDEQRKEEMRQQKLREMEQNARSMEEQRSSYVSKINAEEAEQEKREAALRQKLLDARSKGHSDGKGVFLADQQRKTFGDHVDLAGRLGRDRGRLQRLD
uniref:CBF1-interacting co-repressor CIR N-terminal domain-containing protein n=1 Tax=Kalmanozyma brasiliensis (strain GHG001) TaxID=1365824 RepID=V5EYS4_KALBG